MHASYSTNRSNLIFRTTPLRLQGGRGGSWRSETRKNQAAPARLISAEWSMDIWSGRNVCLEFVEVTLPEGIELISSCPRVLLRRF